jgi:hypothetical protein
MANSNDKAKVKKHISNILRKELKYGNYVSIIVDILGRSALLWVFHQGIGGGEQNHHLNRVARYIEEQANGEYHIVVTSSFPEEGFDISHFTPFYVLKALRDQEQFNRGIGGKSAHAIHRWCKEKFAELSPQEVARDLNVLIQYGVVVLSLSGTYWFRPDFREKMDANGISFLPAYKV